MTVENICCLSNISWGGKQEAASVVLRGSTIEVEILILALEARSEQNSLTVIELAAFIVLV